MSKWIMIGGQKYLKIQVTPSNRALWRAKDPAIDKLWEGGETYLLLSGPGRLCEVRESLQRAVEAWEKVAAKEYRRGPKRGSGLAKLLEEISEFFWSWPR